MAKESLQFNIKTAPITRTHVVLKPIWIS